MIKKWGILISLIYLTSVLLTNSFGLAFSQPMIFPGANLRANQLVSGKDPILHIRFLDLTGGQVPNNAFNIQVVNNNQLKPAVQFPPSQDVSLDSGSYFLQITANAVVNPNNQFRVNRDSGCSSLTSGPIDQDRTCNLSVTTGNLIGEQQAETIFGGGTGTNHSLIPEQQASVVIERKDNLFESCQQVQVNTPTGTSTITPSSALYTIEGTGNIGKIAKDLKNGDPITFQIQGDLVDNQYPQLSLSNPPLIASIQSGEDPFPVKDTPFKTTKITTDCKFYTLVRPDAEDKFGKFAPKGMGPFKSLGTLDKDLSKDNTIVKAKTDLTLPSVLLGGTILTDKGSNIAVNPPFRGCIPLVDTGSGDIATYVIRGEPDISKISFSGTHTLQLRLYVDLVPTPDDLARIINTNNQFVRIDLVVDPGKSSTQVIDFTPTEISTDCKGVGFSTSPLVH